MLPLPPETEAILFDVDGTLIDSMPLHIVAWNQALEPHGVQTPDGFIDEHAGRPTDVIVGILNQMFGTTIDPAPFTVEKERLFIELLPEAKPIDQVVATAREHEGKIAMGVVSGGVREIVDANLKAIGLEGFFPVIVTASDDVAPKPSPDIFLEAARRLGVAPERCHVFEDADMGLEAAHAAGMTATDVREVLAAARSAG
ncbi:Fructose-1-phosphate phosphatase YqaB [Pseudobythopirellula maris]|uniref:Fructose-1-phosphate phosphatase YqaB n=1 Tax=Pseudobythopirellula maris TaxID=2527991 RepID=A0A5C5ZTX8_9BACT|nr:HAD family phosphatase [Pseudobythopirellula maris]TWT90478.1 Fructose-1-phosphate phosphatase YqaB [Pseudobythopirellula maris]